MLTGDLERTIFLQLAWFPPDRAFAGEPQRPLCLATWTAMRLMGLRLLDEVELEPEVEYRQLMAYLWLHREPREVVEPALWDGSWKAMMEGVAWNAEDPPLELLGLWRELRERLLGLLEASEIVVQPRPKGAVADETPREVVGPAEVAHWVHVVAGAAGMPMDRVLWEVPLYQLRQLYHAEMRWNGHWTVRPVPPVDEGVFEGFGEGVLANLEGQGDLEGA